MFENRKKGQYDTQRNSYEVPSRDYYDTIRKDKDYVVSTRGYYDTICKDNNDYIVSTRDYYDDDNYGFSVLEFLPKLLKPISVLVILLGIAMMVLGVLWVVNTKFENLYSDAIGWHHSEIGTVTGLLKYLIDSVGINLTSIDCPLASMLFFMHVVIGFFIVALGGYLWELED